MKDQRPDEALDACRRDPVDLEWPEMRDLAARLDREPELRAVFQERLEQDELIAARLRSVALSGTSRARLSERIQLAIADCQPTIGPPAIQSTDLPVKGRRLFRAMHVVAAIAVSAAVLLFVGWAVYPGRWAHVGARELAHWALRDWQPTSGQWQRMPLRNPDEGESGISSWLRRSPARWQPLETHLDQASAVYEIPSKKKSSRLFVLHADRRVPGLPSRPPQQPQTEQSGCFFAAWQEDSRVYVLSVPGPLRNYWDVVQAPSALSSDRTRDSADAIRN